jgi:hypothetical protein
VLHPRLHPGSKSGGFGSLHCHDAGLWAMQAMHSTRRQLLCTLPMHVPQKSTRPEIAHGPAVLDKLATCRAARLYLPHGDLPILVLRSTT